MVAQQDEPRVIAFEDAKDLLIYWEGLLDSIEGRPVESADPVYRQAYLHGTRFKNREEAKRARAIPQDG